MTMPGDPTFEPGDEVVDFRGNPAVVVKYIVVDHPSKSNRVQVRWVTHDNLQKDLESDDKIEYYAGVFSHADK